MSVEAGRFGVPKIIPEKSTWRYSGVLVDEADVPIAAADLADLVLTLYNEAGALPILNGVDHQNIKNTDRGTIDASGNLAITFTWQDNALFADVAEETHVALVEWTYGGGLKKGRREIAFRVRNLAKV